MHITVNLDCNEKTLIVSLLDLTIQDRTCCLVAKMSFKHDSDETIQDIYSFLFFFPTSSSSSNEIISVPLPLLSQPIDVWLNSTDTFKTHSRGDFLQKAFYDTKLISGKCLKLPHYSVPGDTIYFQSV